MKLHVVFFSPFMVCTVVGNSMLPTLSGGQKILVQTWVFSAKIHDLVIVKDMRSKKLLIKRIKKIRQTENSAKQYFVIGDNNEESTDSRNFGWIDEKYIQGKVIYPRR